ncbi:MAG: methyl-accepting chemotaxis protein [Salinivirgaceae bacterium]|nr:methyl-accepting chemotaxis protein [Salinivirgaceae bacterium]
MKLKLTGRLLVSVLGAVIVLNATILLIIGLRASKDDKESGFELAMTKSQEVALDIEKYMDQAILTAKGLSGTFTVYKDNQVDRINISNLLKELLVKNDNFLAFWAMWEPNSYDGLDQKFVEDDLYKSASGTIDFTFYKSNGEVYPEPGTLDQYQEDYYTLPKESKKLVVMDPYMYSYTGNEADNVYETTVAMPIFDKGSFIGVVGIDIELKMLNTIISGRKIYETGFAAIISDQLQIAAHPDKEYSQKKLDEVFKTDLNKISDAIKNGKQLFWTGKSEKTGQEVIRCFSPVKLGDSDTLWSVMVEIPMEEVSAKAQEIVLLTLLIGVIGLIVLSIILYLIAVNITRPIIKSMEFSKKISEGDLSATLDIRTHEDEIGELVASLNKMSIQIKNIVDNIIENADSILTSSMELSNASQQLSQGANEQAAAVEEVSASMEQMASNISQNDDNSKAANIKSTNSLKGISEVSKSTMKVVEASRTISGKIKIVNDIAFQTNILALNAAVEAARAGEHGKGFAIVAAEVRKLAERSKTAADEIVALAYESLTLAETTGQFMMQVVPDLEKATDLVNEITAATNEQASGASQVNGAIQQLNSVAQMNAASSEELAGNAQELSVRAQELKELVAFFK